MTQHTVESSKKIVIDLKEKKPIRVLHVDDEPGLLKIAKQCLEMQGSFQVAIVSSAEEALEKLKKESFDAVVSDYQMSGKDGLQFLKELRESRNDVPFVIFTGKGREEVAVTAWNLGADHYVDKNGNPEVVYSELSHCLREAVEKHAAETQARETTEKLHAIYENAVEGISLVDAQENLVYVNKAFAEILGCKEDQLVGTNLRRFVDEESWTKIRNETESRQKGKTNRYELVFHRPDGAARNVQISASPLFDSYGRFGGTVGIVLDITEGKKAEEKLRESEEKFRNLAEQSPDMIFINKKGRVVYANQRAEEVMGYTREEFASPDFNFLTLIAPESREQVKSNFANHMKGKEASPFEYKIVTKQGNAMDAILSSKLIDYEGEQQAILGTVTDITERKKAEEKLRESEEKFRALFNEAMDAVFVADAETGIIVDCNQAAMELVGRTKQELIGKHQRILHPEPEATNEGLSNTFQQHIGERKGQVLETQIITKDGEIKEVAIKGNIIEVRGRKLIQGIFRDISEHKKAEESEQKFRDLYEAILDPISIYVGREGRLIDYNKAFKRLSGYADEELKDKTFLDFVHPDDRASVLEKYQTTYAEKELPLIYEIRGLNKRGEAIPLEITVSKYKKKGRVIGIEVIHRDITDRKKVERTILDTQQNFEALFAGNPEAAVHVGPDFCILDVNPRFEMLFGYKLDEIKGRNINDVVVPKDKIDEAQTLNLRTEQDKHVSQATVRRKKDGSLVPVFVSAAQITASGRYLGYVAVYKDISELKNTEKKLEITNEKLRVTGGLTRHDVRNKLSTITGNAYLLKKQLAGDDSALDKLIDIDAAVDQTLRILDFAKTYEMLGAEQLVYVDVEKTVNEAISLFSGLKNIKVTNDCHGLNVLADSLLRQLFYNLIDNSLKYGKKITQIRIHYEKTGTDQLNLIYTDDGTGISEDVRQKLFTEGFTTGKGTGYGLYLTKKMVEVYGWTIQETGTPGKGAQFTLTIPNINTNGKENYQLY